MIKQHEVGQNMLWPLLYAMKSPISYNTILIEQLKSTTISLYYIEVRHLYLKRRKTTVHQTEHSAGERHMIVISQIPSLLNASIENVHDPDVRYLYLKGERSTSTKQNQTQLDIM